MTHHPMLDLVLTFGGIASVAAIFALTLKWGVDRKIRLALCAARVLSAPVRLPPDR